MWAGVSDKGSGVRGLRAGFMVIAYVEKIDYFRAEKSVGRGSMLLAPLLNSDEVLNLLYFIVCESILNPACLLPPWMP